jgi:hypothetical protein
MAEMMVAVLWFPGLHYPQVREYGCQKIEKRMGGFSVKADATGDERGDEFADEEGDIDPYGNPCRPEFLAHAFHPVAKH